MWFGPLSLTRLLCRFQCLQDLYHVSDQSGSVTPAVIEELSMTKFSIVVALVAGTGFASAQDIPRRPPDPLARPTAPAITQAPDGVRNGTTKEERDQHIPDPLARPAAPATTQTPDGVRNGATKGERDQHIEAGAPGQTPPAQTLRSTAPTNR
jgi:hypothetical protein